MKKLSVVMWLMFAAPVMAQLVFPPPQLRPAAATALYPNGVVNNANARVLRWRQGGLFATQPQPPAAQYFRICIYDLTLSQTCGAPTVQWFYAASDSALNRTPVVPPFNSPPIVSTYAYSFNLPNTVPLDLPLRWKVRACANQNPSSCTESQERALHLSTKNITAVDLNEEIHDDRITVTPAVRNNGTTNSGPVSVQVWIHEALYDPAGKCATSVGVGGAQAGDIAVRADGQEVPLDSSNVPGTIAIYRPSVAAEFETFSSLSLAAGALGAGQTIEHAPLASLPAAYLLLMRADNPEALIEFDETDNMRAECHVVFP